jgi:dTDP-4-dehydrorhamnose reductase
MTATGKAAARLGTVLLTGGSGQLGSELNELLSPVAEVIAPGRKDLDLTDPASIRSAVRSIRPRWIVNPAAYTAVDKAESEPDLAYTVNAEAVEVLGQEARSIGAAVLHFSTDYVFSGEGDRPYREEDLTGPLGVYGASKLAGEERLARSGAGFITLRTSWVFGARGKNFLKTILKLAHERDSLNIVDDQHGSPTWSRNLAEMARDVMLRSEEKADGKDLAEVLQALGGVYHAAGSGYTTWYGFAEAIAGAARAESPGARVAIIHPIATAQYPTPAKRPANSRLSCDKLRRVFSLELMPWEKAVSGAMVELMAHADV